MPVRWTWHGSWEEIKDAYLVSGVTVPRDVIGADNCSEYMNT